MDPISAVGLAAAILQFVELATKVAQRFAELSDAGLLNNVPPAFRQQRIKLPLVVDGLRKLQARYMANESSSGGALDPYAQDSLIPVVEECRRAVCELDRRLDKIVPPKGASAWTRGKMAISSVVVEHDIQNLDKTIDRLLSVLTFHQVLQIGVPGEKASASPPPLILPFDRNQYFIGREKVFETIDAAFASVGPDSQPKAAIYGLGGIGKSQIALEYCYRRRVADSRLSIFWVNAATTATFEESFYRIASHCNLITGREVSSTDYILLVEGWLHQTLGRQGRTWLMVVDNVDDRASFFTNVLRTRKHATTPYKCIPCCSHGSILFTTRAREIAADLIAASSVEPIPVLELSPTEGMRLVTERLQWQEAQSTLDDVDVLALVTAVECIPIAIIQAVSYISKRKKSIPEYLDHYRKSDTARMRMLAFEFADKDGRLRSVAKTWAISFDAIRSSNWLAYELLCVMSFFQCQGIPQSLLLDIMNHRISEKAVTASNGGGAVASRFEDTKEEELEDALAVLKDYSFLDVSNDAQTTTYSTHQLVQLATRWWLMAEGGGEVEVANWAFVGLRVLARSFPLVSWEKFNQYRTSCELLLTHADSCLSYSGFASLSAVTGTNTDGSGPPHSINTPSARNADLQKARLLDRVGDYHMLHSSHDAALASFEKSFSLREEHLGERALETIMSLNKVVASLAYDPSDSGIPRAVTLGRRLFELTREILGPDDLMSINASTSLAAALNREKNYKESEALCREAIARCIWLFGTSRGITHTCMQTLSESLEGQAKTSEAIEVLRRVYELKVASSGRERPDTVICGNSLAILLLKGGDDTREEGLAMMRKSIVDMRKVFGHDHPRTLQSADFVATCLLNHKEDLEGASAIIDETLNLVTATAPRSDNPNTRQSVQDLVALRKIIKGSRYIKEVSRLITEICEKSNTALKDLKERAKGRGEILLLLEEACRRRNGMVIGRNAAIGRFLSEGEQESPGRLGKS